MPRRREVPKRVILPDPKYNDKLIAKYADDSNTFPSGGVALITYDTNSEVPDRVFQDVVVTRE